MNQQEINHSQSVNALKQQINDLATQLHQQQAATQQFNHTQPHPTMPPDTSFHHHLKQLINHNITVFIRTCQA